MKPVGTVEVHTCYSIDCSDCGSDCWEEGTPHFESEDELWKSIEDDYEWTRVHGRPLCRSCSEKADCKRDGHNWGDWREYHRDPGILVRFCDHCNDLTDGYEEHLLALGDPR